MIKLVQLSSKIENISAVESLIDEISVSNKIGSEVYGNMLVAIIEAVSNSIIHGNKVNPDKMVSISYKLEDNTIEFSIKDEGEGFDFYNVPDPTLPGNMEKPNGRGVFLMNHLADEICYYDKGREVRLKFKIK